MPDDPFEELRVEWQKLMDRAAVPMVDAFARLMVRRPWGRARLVRVHCDGVPRARALDGQRVSGDDWSRFRLIFGLCMTVGLLIFGPLNIATGHPWIGSWCIAWAAFYGPFIVVRRRHEATR